jgi:Ca2+:H+ antiporter
VILLQGDTVFSAIMIVMNGVVGISILMGCLKHHELSFRVEGTNPALAVITALATLTLLSLFHTDDHTRT